MPAPADIRLLTAMLAVYPAMVTGACLALWSRSSARTWLICLGLCAASLAYLWLVR